MGLLDRILDSRMMDRIMDKIVKQPIPERVKDAFKDVFFRAAHTGDTIEQLKQDTGLDNSLIDLHAQLLSENTRYKEVFNRTAELMNSESAEKMMEIARVVEREGLNGHEVKATFRAVAASVRYLPTIIATHRNAAVVDRIFEENYVPFPNVK